MRFCFTLQCFDSLQKYYRNVTRLLLANYHLVISRLTLCYLSTSALFIKIQQNQLALCDIDGILSFIISCCILVISTSPPHSGQLNTNPLRFFCKVSNRLLSGRLINPACLGQMIFILLNYSFHINLSLNLY